MLIFVLLVIISFVKSIAILLLDRLASLFALTSNAIDDPKMLLFSNSIDDTGELGLFVVNPGGRMSFQLMVE